MVVGAVAGWRASSVIAAAAAGVLVSAVVGALWAFGHRRELLCAPALAVLFWLSVFGWLTLGVTSVEPLSNWIASVPVPYAFVVVAAVKFVSVVGALCACRRGGLSRGALMIAAGRPAGPSGLRLGRMKVRWPVVGPIVIAVVLALFMTSVPASVSRWEALAHYALVIVAGSVLNAVAEELLYRHTLIAALRRVTAVRVAVLYSSLIFGVGHLSGNPGGFTGLLFTAAFGAVCAWAMLTTNGMTWNIPIHVAGDIGVQYTLL